MGKGPRRPAPFRFWKTKRDAGPLLGRSWWLSVMMKEGDDRSASRQSAKPAIDDMSSKAIADLLASARALGTLNGSMSLACSAPPD